MEAKVIVTTELQLKALIADAVIAAFKYHQPSTSPIQTKATSKKIDFPTLMKEYYPGIPESTVRQATAHLGRTKVGRRVLFDRQEVEENQQSNRLVSTKELTHNVEVQFNNHNQRRGGRKTA